MIDRRGDRRGPTRAANTFLCGTGLRARRQAGTPVPLGNDWHIGRAPNNSALSAQSVENSSCPGPRAQKALQALGEKSAAPFGSGDFPYKERIFRKENALHLVPLIHRDSSDNQEPIE
jgi:hypothetical protein